MIHTPQTSHTMAQLRTLTIPDVAQGKWAQVQALDLLLASLIQSLQDYNLRVCT